MARMASENHLVMMRCPSRLTGALKQQGWAQVKKRGWSICRRSMGMSQKATVASSIGVNFRLMRVWMFTSAVATSPDRM